MARTALHFQSEDVAHKLVAGLPLALRAVLALAQQRNFCEETSIQLVAPDGWSSPYLLDQEINRAVPSLKIVFASNTSSGTLESVDGFTLALTGHSQPWSDHETGSRSAQEVSSAIRAASTRLVQSTGKQSDGFVSEHLNRPISQFISLRLLKLSWIRPIHGTIAACILGLAMALCLFFGGEAGLYAGAILFQSASIIDGVDGEIARATLRTSKMGATLDTAGDAATNFSFIAGVSFNLWQSGDTLAGLAGAAGLGLLFLGLSILGGLSLRDGGPLSFDAVKDKAKATASPTMTILAKLTSRDVYALLLAIMILIGLAGPAMILFAIAIATWFIVAMAMLIRA